MNSLKLPGRFALVFLLATWGYFLFFMPTFDFDESLYRRVAEEMKLSHDYWRMTWDHWPVNHKPPLFYWLICIFSFAVDGSAAGVSSLAARLPNFCASLGILGTLYWAGKKVADDSTRAGWAPVLAFTSALFPILTATTVIFDPIQTLALMPSLIIPTLVFHRGVKLKPLHWTVWSLSLFLSCALKGLNGMVIPSLALGFHLLINIKNEGVGKTFRFGLRFLGFVFLPAVALTALFYFGLDHRIGPQFTHEFLWIQHFERSQVPMEEHSGSYLYHFWVIFFGAGFLAPLLLDRARRTKVSYGKQGFPLTYAFTFVLVFSFSATKLPHYTWPVWPALALYFGVLLSLVKETGFEPSKRSPLPLQQVLKVVSFLPVLILGMTLLALATQSDLLLQTFAKSLAAQSVAKQFGGFEGWEKSLFFVGAITCFFSQLRRRSITASVETNALLAAFVTLCLVLGLGRTARNLMVMPFEEMAQTLKLRGVQTGDCIRYSGAQSPTFSLALGNQIFHNRCEPQDLKYLVAPEWKAQECETRNLSRLEQKSYLVLCGKK
ncbi:MAG: hypothetical protein H7333_11560 [Bdellovibrionales bacterium]|nr:hypothetical protein [Oligoflexia bacterium]